MEEKAAEQFDIYDTTPQFESLLLDTMVNFFVCIYGSMLKDVFIGDYVTTYSIIYYDYMTLTVTYIIESEGAIYTYTQAEHYS